MFLSNVRWRLEMCDSESGEEPAGCAKLKTKINDTAIHGQRQYRWRGLFSYDARTLLRAPSAYCNWMMHGNFKYTQ
jgi:hypothetical protein